MKKEKSDLSKCSAESEALDSDLKIAGNVGSGYESDNVYRTDGISPTLKAQTGGKTKGSQLILDASGQMTTINMPVRSTEKDSEQRNLSKPTSETSEQIKYLNMNFLQEDFPVKLFPLPENAKVFKTKQKELFSTKYAVLLEVKDQDTYSLRMLKDYFLTTMDGPLQLYCFHWMNLGMMSNGRCLTLNIGSPKTGKGSLSSVLEEKVDEKYYLNKEYLQKMAEYNLRQKIAGRGFQFEPKEQEEIADALQSSGGQEGGLTVKEAWCIPEATLRGKKLPFMGGPPRPKKEMTHPLSASARYFVVGKAKVSPADWIKKVKKDD